GPVVAAGTRVGTDDDLVAPPRVGGLAREPVPVCNGLRRAQGERFERDYMLHHFAIGRVLVNDGFKRLQIGYFFFRIDGGREKAEPVGSHRGALVATALGDGAETVAIAS